MIEFKGTEEIPVMEHFFTLQGEGFHQGKAAYFIRLAGCDVGCVWCDVKESWTVNEDQLTLLDDLVKAVSACPANMVVITGGEPAMYDLSPLCQMLHEAGKKVHIETSGAYPLLGEFDWICVSPKKFKAPLDEVLGMAQELKVIVYNRADLEWARTFENRVKNDCILLLQPEWSREKRMMDQIVKFVKDHPHWRVSLQTHKYMDIP